MSSLIEQATVALEAVLVTGLPTVTVTRNHDVPVNFVTESTPTLNLVDGDDEDVRKVAANTVEFDSQVVLAGYVTAADPADLGPARDELWTAVWALVDANYQLGGLTWNVEQGKTSRRLESEPGKPVAVFEMPVTLRLKAQASDVSVAA